MPKLKKRFRRGEVPVLREAGVLPSASHGGQDVRRDRRLALSAAALSSKLTAIGVHRQEVLLALEACVGGASFGEHSFKLELGLRFAFLPVFGGESPRTPDGRQLVRFGVEGDLEYFVTEEGEVWTQNGIADRLPHRRGRDPVAFATEYGWPNLLDLEPLAAALGAAT